MKKGFSIIEVIVVIAIFIVIVPAIFSLYLGYREMFFLGNYQLDVIEQGRNSFDEFSNYVKQANKVLESITIDGDIYNSGQETLVLQLQAIDASGSLIDDVFDYVVFYKQENMLYRILKKDPLSFRNEGTKVLATDVSSLSFSYDNQSFASVRKIGIEIGIQKQLKDKTISNQVSEQAFLRNY